MKRSLAIALVAILLLNTLGYYAVFLGIQYKQDVAARQVLDSDSYNEANTITIKFPISVPYMSDNAGFERVDGLFEYQGEHFRLVKQKYAKDTLTIVCIRDSERTRLHQELADYVSTFSDKANDHAPAENQAPGFIKDYLPHYLELQSTSTGWESEIQMTLSRHCLTPTFEASIIHPPQRNA